MRKSEKIIENRIKSALESNEKKTCNYIKNADNKIRKYRNCKLHIA